MNLALTARMPGLSMVGRGEGSGCMESDQLKSVLSRLSRRDPKALETVVQMTRDQAWRLAYSILPDRHLCEDVLQDAYLTVYEKIDQLRDPERFRSWFSQIVVHRCRREFRGPRWESLDNLTPAQQPQRNSLDQVTERLALSAALAELSPQDRAVLSLRELSQLSYQEIADALDIPVGTVRSRLFYARQRMLNWLSGSQAGGAQ